MTQFPTSIAETATLPIAPRSRGIDRLYLFFMANYLAQGLAGVAYEPISYLLKDVLRLSPGQSAQFTAWMTLPFLVKPCLGLVTDALPILGRRRIPYLFATSLATVLAWMLLAGLKGYAYLPALLLLTAVNVGTAFSDVLCDAVMVEHGKKLSKTGPYQAAQIGTLYLALVASGLGGGYLAANASYRTIFNLTAVFPALIFASTFLVAELPEERSPSKAWTSLGTLVVKPSFWAVAAIIVLFNFNPFLGTAFFYYQSETLKFSKVLIGALSSIDALSGALGAALFWRLYNKEVSLFGRTLRLDTTTLVRTSVLAGAPLTLLYLAYRGAAPAVALTALFGLCVVWMRLSLMDMAAKACPLHSEATSFALFMSLFNLAAWGSNTAGGKFYGAFRGTLGPHRAIALLILVAAACTLSCLPLVRWVREEAS